MGDITSIKNFLCACVCLCVCVHQAISAQEDLEKTKAELHTAMMPPAPDEASGEASAELLSEGGNGLRSEEERITEAQKNQRVKQQLQVEH